MRRMSRSRGECHPRLFLPSSPTSSKPPLTCLRGRGSLRSALILDQRICNSDAHRVIALRVPCTGGITRLAKLSWHDNSTFQLPRAAFSLSPVNERSTMASQVFGLFCASKLNALCPCTGYGKLRDTWRRQGIAARELLKLPLSTADK